MTSVTISDSVTSIGDHAFDVCDSLKNVYYSGSESDWNKIDIGGYNEDLTNATIHYNSVDKSGGDTEGYKESINNSYTSSISLVIYENKKDSGSVTDSYRLSGGAVVTNGNDSAVSPANGSVTIVKSGNDVTVSKDGYLSRTISENRAANIKEIHLQKNTGSRPVIQAVWIGDTDVYNHDCKLDITSTESVTLTAEVVWKGGSQSKIYLMQDARRVDFTSNTLTTVISDSFDVSETIYIVAEDANGNSTKKPLKIKADGNIADVLNDWKLSFGDSISAAVPDSIPVIGGGKVGIDVPLIPLSVSFEDNKFYGVLGFDVAKAEKNYSYIANINGNTQSKYEKTTKFLFENIKDNFKKSADSWSMKELKSKWKKAKYNYSATMGFEADLTVMGYVEGYVDSNGKVIILDSGVGINPSFGVEVGSQIIPVPPLYWEASLKGEIEAMVSLYTDDTAKNFTPNGSLGGKITLKGGVGLGASGVIGVSGGVSGSIGVDWDIYAYEQDYIAVSGSIGAYAKAFAGPFTVFDKDFPFAEGIIWDYPSTRMSLNSLYEPTDFYNEESYTLISRDYKNNESFFVANEEEMQLYSVTPQNKTEKTIKQNAYPYSEPQLAEFTDGTMIAVWLDDDADRDDINRTALMYSYYDGSNWSDEAQICDDGTADFYPDMEIIDDTLYIVWVNINSALENEASMNEAFKKSEISNAVFDKAKGQFSDVTAITSNNQIDILPKVFGDGTGVHIVWAANSSDDVFSEDEVYSVMTSSLSDDVWSAASVYKTGLRPIDNLDGALYNGTMQIAYAIDMDGDQSDYSDKEIYLNNTRITENDVIDSKPVFANNCLYYYQDGAIVEYSLGDASEKVIAENISTDRFTVMSDGEKTAVVYGKTEELITEISAVIYDSESDKWSKEILLTDLNSGITSYSGSFSQDGTMKFLINKTAIVGDFTSENPYGQADVVLLGITPAYNLSLDTAVYQDDLLLEGNTLEFYTEITNNGELAVKDFYVQVLDEDGTELGKTYNDEAILPGETIDFTVYYPLGEDEFSPHNVKLNVVAVNAADYDEADNSYDVFLNCEKISVENMNYGFDKNSNTIIYADVVNRGYTQADEITVNLRRDSDDGEIVDTVTIGNTLDTLELAAVNFEVGYEEGAVYYITIDDYNANSEFVVLQSNEEITDMVLFNKATGDITVYSDESIQDAMLIMALYSGDKLDGIKTAAIGINQGTNTIPALISNYSTSDAVRIMVWQSNSDIVPMFDGCYAKIN